jgi:hypothetical protein
MIQGNLLVLHQEAKALAHLVGGHSLDHRATTDAKLDLDQLLYLSRGV